MFLRGSNNTAFVCSPARLLLVQLSLIGSFFLVGTSLATPGFTRADKIIFPVYGTQPGSGGVIVIDSLSRDYLRKGNFKIGVLPVMVAENMSIRFFDRESLNDPVYLQSALSQLMKGRGLRIEGFKLEVEGCPVVVQSDSASFRSREQIELSGNVKFKLNGKDMECEYAVVNFTSSGLLLKTQENTLVPFFGAN